LKIVRSWNLCSLFAAILFATEIAMAAGFEVVVANDFVGGNVSPDGTVVVGVSASEATQIFRWENGTLDFIISTPGPGSGSAASQAGSVVVGLLDLFGSSRAYRWEAGTVTLIPQLPGGSMNFAFDVTTDGSVIVGSSQSTAASGGGGISGRFVRRDRRCWASETLLADRSRVSPGRSIPAAM